MALDPKVLSDIYGDNGVLANPFPTAKEYQPEQMAQGIKIGRAKGIDAMLAADHLPQLHDELDQDHWNEIVKTSPKLAKQMQEPAFAAVAHDDTQNLSTLEKTVSFAKNIGRSIPAGLAGFNEGIYGAVQSVADLGSAALDPLVGTILPANPFAQMSDAATNRRVVEKANKTALEKARGKVGPTEGAIYSGVESGVQNLLMLPVALASRNPNLLVGTMAAQTEGQGYGDAIDAGKTPVQALPFAVSQGYVEYATEQIPALKLLNGLKAKAPAMQIAKDFLAKEIPGEQVATALQDLNEWAVLNPDKPFTEYLKDRPGAAYQTLVATVVGGGVQVGAGKAIEHTINRFSPRIVAEENAQQDHQTLAQLDQLAAESKVKARDPATFQQFIAEATQDGPVQDVYIDAKALAQSGIVQDLAQVSPAIRAQFNDAIQTGGSVRIPLDEYAANIAGTEFNQGLLEHLKTDPNGMTFAESKEYAKTYREDFNAELDKVTQELTGDEAFKASAAIVQNEILKQLNETSRYTSEVNDTNAIVAGAHFAVRAAQLGMTPEELYKLRPLKVNGEPILGDSIAQVLPEALPDGMELGDSTKLAAMYRNENAAHSVLLGQTAPQLVSDGAKVNAYLGTFSHSVSKSALIHIQKEHGDEAIETARGQLPITAADIARIPDITSNYDGVRFDLRSDGDRPAIAYVKRTEDGVLLYTEEVHNKRHDLSALALRKYPATRDAIEILNSVRQNVRNGNGHTLSIGKAPGESNTTAQAKGSNFTQELARGLEPSGVATSSNPKGILSQKSNDSNRGAYSPSENTITLLKNADLSTFLHELGHAFLEMDVNLTAQLAGNTQVTEGEQEILNDVGSLFNWFGLQGNINAQLDQWYAMTLDEQRTYHEKMAEGFESYLFEGKAPSIELQPLFQRMRAWFMHVYRNLSKYLSDAGESLTPEVRGVFDRMLASTEQIKLSQQARSMLPLFETADQAGMTPDEFAAYQRLDPQATQDAIAELQSRGLRDMKWLSNARAKQLKKLQKEAAGLRREVRSEVTTEIMSQPVYRAWTFLTAKLSADDKLSPATSPKSDPNVIDETQDQAPIPGADLNTDALKAGRLDRGALTATYGTAEGSPVAGLNTLRMTSTTGLHPDIVAEMFGFSSGDQLVKALLDAQPPKQAVEDATDTRMLERHGDLSSPEALGRAADKAIHNDVRARMISTELNALSKATGKKATLASAAREFATAMIARIKVRNIKPNQYAVAEAKAAKNAAAAMRKSDLETAAAEKRNQLVNNYATKAALNARDEIDQGVAYLRKFGSDGVRKSIDVDYLDQIDAMLERFDLRTGVSLKAIDKRTALLEWMNKQRDQGLEPDIPPELMNEALRMSYKDMSLEAFRGLVDSVKQIEHLGRLKNRLLTAKDQRTYEAIRDIITTSIIENAGDRKANTRTPTTNTGRAIQSVKNFWASHLKASIWARIMDGGQDGGPVWEYVIRSANEAANFETHERGSATEALSKILAPVFKLGKMGGKGQYFASIDRSLNRESRIAIALNTGNASNYQRLLGGEGWTAQQVQPVLDSLTKAEWDAVQAIWDHFETYRPQIAAKERRVYGKEPNWVEATAVHNAHGEYRGGYYPIKYDPNASQRAEEHVDAEGAKRQLQGAYTSATTRRSFTKTRVDEVNGRPLLYTLAGVYSGVNDVIHDLAWHEWLIDVNRLMRSSTIDSAIRDHYGPEVKRQLKSWIQDIAEGERGADNAGEMVLGKLRQGVSIAGLGFNVLSAAIQITGFNQSIVRVGAKWIGRGVTKYLASPIQSTREVTEQSEFMADRFRTQFRELNELRNSVQDQSAAKRALQDGAYFMMTRVQQMVDVPTWLGAYEKAISQGNVEERAVSLADQAVIEAQMSGMSKDLSAIERGGPAMKLFTVFYSFMNTSLNLGVMKAMTEKNKAKLAADFLLLYVAGPVLTLALKNALTPGDADDDWDFEALAKALLGESLGFLMGQMVVVREFAEAGKNALGLTNGNFGYQGPAGVRVIADTTKFVQQAQQGEFDDAFRKASVNLVGPLFGLPAAQVNRSITGINALTNGKTGNPAAAILGYQEPH